MNLGEVSDGVDLSRVRVLMVDDDSDACEILRRVLQEYGAIVDSAPSVMQALEHLKQVSAQHHQRYRNAGMPDMDGYELTRRSLWGHNDSGDRSDGFRWFRRPNAALPAGFNMYLVKPLEPQELVKV